MPQLFIICLSLVKSIKDVSICFAQYYTSLLKLMFVCFCFRLDKEFAVHLLVGGERREEQHHHHFQTGWTASRDHYQRHQVLCERAIQCWQKKYKLARLLGPIRWRFGRCFWQSNCAETSWLKNIGVEQILCLFPHWSKLKSHTLYQKLTYATFCLVDEKYIRGRVKEVWEEGFGPVADQESHVNFISLCIPAQTYLAGDSLKATYVRL